MSCLLQRLCLVCVGSTVLLCAVASAKTGIWAGYSQGLKPTVPTASFYARLPQPLKYGNITVDYVEYPVESMPLVPEGEILKCDVVELGGSVLRLHLSEARSNQVRERFKGWSPQSMGLRLLTFTSDGYPVLTHEVPFAAVSDSMFHLHFGERENALAAMGVLCGNS